MAKSNDVCGVGVAYECNLGGLKLNFSDVTDLTSAAALGRSKSYIDIYSNSWGPDDLGYIVDGPAYLTTLTLENGALSVKSLERYINYRHYYMYSLNI